MVIYKIALRNLYLHKVKTAVIGSIIIFGTVLAIVGNAFVDAISSGMKKSLVNSLVGDLQIYSSEAKEKLALYGSMDGTLPDIGHMSDFGKVRDTLLSHVDNIRSIIPMGTSFTMMNPGNILDIKLEELRALFKSRDNSKIPPLIEHVRTIVSNVSYNYHSQAKGVFPPEKDLSQNNSLKDAPKNLKKATSEAFWTEFPRRHEQSIEFLANWIAPLIFDDNMLAFGFLGTVPNRFSEAFSLFEIVKGERIPDGKRGYLFNDFLYETTIKNRVARRLDSIKKQMEKNGLKIATDKSLKDLIQANTEQTAEIYTQLDPVSNKKLIPELKKITGSPKNDIKDLLVDFLRVTDENFSERFQFFYDRIAPHIILYKVKIGELFPVSAFTKSGYSSSINVRVYGTYHFKGFESSPIAGSYDLIDMISFRELYGFMTEERRHETQELESEMGLRDFDRSEVEQMFNEQSVVRDSFPGAKPFDSQFAFSVRKKIDTDRVFTTAEMEDGVFMHASVILKDHSRVDETISQIRQVAREEKLPIQIATWIDSAGIIGQLIFVVRAVLYSCAFILFVVAAFIIMNSMLMATWERSREIGTMRAIGARKKFILALFFNEALYLSTIFGLIGTIIGITIVCLIGYIGIPAKGDVASFFFSGPRLYLTVNFVHVLVVLVFMAVISLVSTQYPAWRATRISPLLAMQKNE